MVSLPAKGGIEAATAPRSLRAELPVGGCFISPEQFAAATNTGEPFGSTAVDLFERKRHFRSTGNDALDRDLDKGLQAIAALLYVTPAFGFYDPNRVKSSQDPESRIMNAFAHPESTDILGTEGTVGFGWDLFASELKRDPTGTTIIAIAAHEFGHIWQFFQSHRLKQLGMGMPLKCEIHADVLAGYYLGARKLRNPSLHFKPAEDLFERLGALAEGRANRTHGNKAERVDAVSYGFRLGYLEKRDLRNAAVASLEYVGIKM